MVSTSKRGEDIGFYDKPYLIASPETGIPMAKALGKHKAVVLVGHGAATVSTAGPEDCVQALMELDQLCRITWMAFSAVGRDYEKYAIAETTFKEGRRLSAAMTGRFATPGRNVRKDQCYYNAAMVGTFREAVEG